MFGWWCRQKRFDSTPDYWLLLYYPKQTPPLSHDRPLAKRGFAQLGEVFTIRSPMDEWSKSFLESLESLVDIVDEVIVEVADIIEDFAEEWQNTIGAEIDKCLEDIFEPILEIYLEYDEIDITNEPDMGFTYPVDPTPERHPACIGCSHYHGQVYGGNLLVCGMHPYGWDDENCPDWESNPSIYDDFNPF